MPRLRSFSPGASGSGSSGKIALARVGVIQRQECLDRETLQGQQATWPTNKLETKSVRPNLHESYRQTNLIRSRFKSLSSNPVAGLHSTR
jgi:hypothetical protein